jgi:excinuclease ABC subunit C
MRNLTNPAWIKAKGALFLLLGLLAAALTRFENPPMIISLAKQEETIFSPYVGDPVQLPDNHPARRLVERIRDEVHRYAVSYHRLLRGKQFKGSALEKIPGIGARTAKLLLLKFGSLKRIREASADELSSVRGITPAFAENLLTMFKNQTSPGLQGSPPSPTGEGKN